MKVYNGFCELLQEREVLPETGWVFVDKGQDIDSLAVARDAKYYVAETELEEIEFERSKRTFVECPSLMDVVSVLEKRQLKASAEAYLDAVIFYRKNDSFKE
ncbi:hypothetical protein [Pseudomonas sp. F3-2]|uniref:hypothetical protein n=1 Tax=Pseudomonas sp. F3-2 TaxID=3141539 RepID=UPI00315D7596